MPPQIFDGYLSKLSIQKLLKLAVADSNRVEPERIVVCENGFQVSKLPVFGHREFLSLKI